MTPVATMSARDLVATYFQTGYRPVFWPQNGDAKGPHRDGWPNENPTLADYTEGYRVGILTGTEIAPASSSPTLTSTGLLAARSHRASSRPPGSSLAGPPSVSATASIRHQKHSPRFGMKTRWIGCV